MNEPVPITFLCMQQVYMEYMLCFGKHHKFETGARVVESLMGPRDPLPITSVFRDRVCVCVRVCMHLYVYVRRAAPLSIYTQQHRASFP